VDILYLLIPLSVVLLLVIVGVFGWAVHSGQFDELESQGRQPLLDSDQDRDHVEP
jgi:cbb3-type cytochrome oxidase maturation protein